MSETDDSETSQSGGFEEGKTLWSGRFGAGPADALMNLSRSVHFDARLAREDIENSRAHVAMLASVGILTERELAVLSEALDSVWEEFALESFEFLDSDEDIHSAIERRVTEVAGPVGGKIHSGRSRNDQVATDLRLFARREILTMAELLIEFQSTLLQLAREYAGSIMPGYTHTQRAQPVLLGHHLLAYFWPLGRDVDRLSDCLRRTNVSPLGAGALAGTTLPIDVEKTAKLLGFDHPFQNSLDAVSDRDFVAELLAALSICMVHLSRMGEEIVLWSSDEFGFIRLADAFSTGSSMMPQKKNPDVGELVRGKTGRVIGDLVSVLTMLKGLPFAYNRDLQEDKEPLFDAIDTLKLCVPALQGLYLTVEFNEDVLKQAASSPFLAATDLAEFLVSKGVAFREAHEKVGKLVRQALERGVSLEDLAALDPDFGGEGGEEVRAVVQPGAPVERRNSWGSASTKQLAVQISEAAKALETERSWFAN